MNAPSPEAVSKLRTPGLILGPFYPVSVLALATSNLWVCGEPVLEPRHRPLALSGRVTNLVGNAVAGALIEIWQADEYGRYRHPSATSPGPDDAGFVGYAATRTDGTGLYRFSTLKPGPYGEGLNRRAPHIHFQVTGSHDRLVTQMFFPDEPLNAGDPMYGSTCRARQLVGEVVSDTPRELRLYWDIVLSTG